MSLRKLWLKVHRWLALTLGVLLAFVALLGAALTIAKPVDIWAHPQLFSTGSAAPLAFGQLEQARQALTAEFGGDASLTFRPPREPGETLWVAVRGPWHGTVYFDPATGRELGRRGEHEGLYNLMFELHGSLLMDDSGKAVLAAVALAYLLLLATGLVLWWPSNWSRAWSVELKRGVPRALFDLHRVGGSLLGGLVALSVASGAYMAWRPLTTVVTALAGAEGVRPPAVPAGAAASPRVALDEGVRRAQALFPGAMVGYVQVPAGASKPVRVRLKLADDPHTNGLTSVWLNPVSGEVLRADRWSALDPGARATTWIYPLHTGELGGLLHTVLNAILSLALVGFAVSGVWLWWRRRPARVANASLSRRSTT
jgi:uncharacterized iron-regulated membrane protein